jgi:hypothetical protein
MNMTEQISAGKRRRRLLTDALAVAVAVVMTTAFVAGAADKRKGESERKQQRKKVPESQEVESKNGLKIRGAELVGDGGLLYVRYTVLDPDKAEKVKKGEGTANGPSIENKKNKKVLSATGGMKHDHKLRAGQTDFVLYQNTGGAVKKGDTIDITIGGSTLSKVPVE